jgi:hypothetical protein
LVSSDDAYRTEHIITMAEETERQVKEEAHHFKDEKQGETSNEPFESDIKEP